MFKNYAKDWIDNEGETICPGCKGCKEGKKVKRIKIWCDIQCVICGTNIGYFYQNSQTIATIKKQSRNWKDIDKYGGTVCPSCQQDIKDGTIEDVMYMYQQDNKR